jgi:hypothetical protein
MRVDQTPLPQAAIASSLAIIVATGFLTSLCYMTRISPFFLLNTSRIPVQPRRVEPRGIEPLS